MYRLSSYERNYHRQIFNFNGSLSSPLVFGSRSDTAQIRLLAKVKHATMESYPNITHH